MITKTIAVFFVGTLSFANSAQATLIDRGGGLIYDSDLNITWMANANFGVGSPYDDGASNSDGRMTWASAVAWADQLVFSGYDDWRLPTTALLDSTCEIQTGQTSFGRNCIGNEMGHLFYLELGGVAGTSILSSGDSDLALFQNIRDDISINYWFGSAWFGSDKPGFHFYNGTLNYGVAQNEFYAWAVRDGDVAAIPEPETYALILAGLGLIGLMASRRKTN